MTGIIGAKQWPIYSCMHILTSVPRVCQELWLCEEMYYSGKIVRAYFNDTCIFNASVLPSEPFVACSFLFCYLLFVLHAYVLPRNMLLFLLEHTFRKRTLLLADRSSSIYHIGRDENLNSTAAWTGCLRILRQWLHRKLRTCWRNEKKRLCHGYQRRHTFSLFTKTWT